MFILANKMLSKCSTFETAWIVYVDPVTLFAKVNWSTVKQLFGTFGHCKWSYRIRWKSEFLKVNDEQTFTLPRSLGVFIWEVPSYEAACFCPCEYSISVSFFLMYFSPLLSVASAFSVNIWTIKGFSSNY